MTILILLLTDYGLNEPSWRNLPIHVYKCIVYLSTENVASLQRAQTTEEAGTSSGDIAEGKTRDHLLQG